MMLRRNFITLLAGAAAWPLTASAQQGGRVRRIGVLMAYGENDPDGRSRHSAFTKALADLGWSNVWMDVRWPGGDINRIQADAQELVGLQPDIILVHPSGIEGLIILARGPRYSARGFPA